MDQLGAMRVFLAIAEAGSLSAAGRRLAMPLTTVSRQLAALEEHLGARLVRRTTRRLALTEPGRRYLEACRRIVEDVEAAEARFGGEEGEPSGELAVTAPVVFGRLHVLPVAGEFLHVFPRVQVRMLLVDRFVDLIEEGVDVAVRVGALSDSSLIATRVGAIQRVLCASPRYLDRRGAPKTPSDLADHDCVTFATLGKSDEWMFRDGKRQQRVQVRSRLVVNTAEAAIDAAISGIGVTRVFSYQAERAIANGSLQAVLTDFERDDIPVSIVHREHRLPRLTVQSFVTFSAIKLRRRLAQGGLEPT